MFERIRNMAAPEYLNYKIFLIYCRRDRFHRTVHICSHSIDHTRTKRKKKENSAKKLKYILTRNIKWNESLCTSIITT